MAVRAALFDLGGVILTSPFEALARYEAANGLPEGFLRQLNATDPDTNAWARLERGEVDAGTFARLYQAEARAAGAEIDATEVLGLLTGELRPAMVTAVRRCGEGLLTGLLTNNVGTMSTGEVDGVSGDVAAVIDVFDVVVESSRLGVRKPEPAFYDEACRRLGIQPSEAVFLDDLGVNLKPARAMGMTTIKVVDPEAAIDELESAVGFPCR